MVEDRIISQLANILDRAMTQHFTKEQQEPAPVAPYSTIKEYVHYTNKRFRRTKDQMERNLTQQQAFEEFLDKNYARRG